MHSYILYFACDNQYYFLKLYNYIAHRQGSSRRRPQQPNSLLAAGYLHISTFSWRRRSTWQGPLLFISAPVTSSRSRYNNNYIIRLIDHCSCSPAPGQATGQGQGLARCQRWQITNLRWWNTFTGYTKYTHSVSDQSGPVTSDQLHNNNKQSSWGWGSICIYRAIEQSSRMVIKGN